MYTSSFCFSPLSTTSIHLSNTLLSLRDVTPPNINGQLFAVQSKQDSCTVNHGICVQEPFLDADWLPHVL